MLGSSISSVLIFRVRLMYLFNLVLLRLNYCKWVCIIYERAESMKSSKKEILTGNWYM